MTGFHLAQVNVGRIVAPLDGPELADFVALQPEINGLADRSPGFVWRMVDDEGADATGIRPDQHDELLLINCSVWESLEALRDFTYHSAHLGVLSRRREWFHRALEPHLALWWIPSGHRPTLAEALERVALVREHGPGPSAFTFRDPHPAPAAAEIA
ncbi:DUF3291 domain-containing protein [Streptomyces sp. NPDC007851]|uniref:DUF3291 domain-containing protein n=1 Tax=Streptomyces sp. NPDC007851 TaxID=3155008 RepID=UPI0033ECDCDE